MDRDEADLKAYQKGYDEARALYENDRFEDALRLAESMLDESALPRYHRIKCYLLAAGYLEDHAEAEGLVEMADSHWFMARHYVSTRGELDPESEGALEELRSDIDLVKNHFQEERAAEWAQQELEWEQQELAREMEGVEDDDGEDGEEVQEVEMGEQVVPGAMVIENYEQVQHDQQKQGHATERKSITSTGTEALHHHRHRPGSVRMEEQASRGSFSPSSPATVMPFRSRAVVPKIKKEALPPTDN
ncbi:hypothetical protein LTR33_010753 [Friedmanniomyces endolithicus]|nr:hypothetical protein LTR33_010753 [Friedmanniomyces endolithicus]